MSFVQHDLVIVTPVYEDVEASTRLFKELADMFSRKLFIVAVDDGSVRQPLDTVGLQAARVEGVVLKLLRNVGHQRAIAIGLGYVAEFLQSHQRVVVLDSDGEDIPATIPALLQELMPEDVDVVVAQRKSRVETWRFKAFYVIYKRIFNLLTGRRISFGNFMAIKPSALKRLVAMQELPIHIASTVLASKLRTVACPLDRGPRYAGQSKMNFTGLALHGFKALMIFAEDVLVRIGMLSAAFAAMAVVGGIAAVALKLIGFATPGWFSVAFGILVLMLLQTGALALMTLMLTGVIRGGAVSTVLSHRDYIDRVLEAPGAAA